MANQVRPPMHNEMAINAAQVVEKANFDLIHGDDVAGVEQADGSVLLVRTANESKVDAGIVILAIGVRPVNKLAVDVELAGIKSGYVAVDDH
ncbi:hypothetical protein SARC_01221 [Sphaeroforma arctica JP610]|uniref:FAD/NAD(P)-binding domain-containing protein n=1 Tax=Sphaeroforma arctica JP610 TaxID=667725 RepID=A0A0L0GCN1_9EUKA|nr:hypothetical protein SARC_01221 [Sphaeroforma arctica JP610]KNC86641.1 hypothetical protein SARC_01221 [Sphaeroforma arctica JP610]|eukprot:XP_014160543.1 hypothetical protein SARC_01221 [Sphaeroforma arctica JP610]